MIQSIKTQNDYSDAENGFRKNVMREVGAAG